MKKQVSHIYHSLSEGLSSVLFHTTKIENLYQILKTNTFDLTLASGANADIRKIPSFRYYFASFARSPSSSYFRFGDSSVYCYFQLDGRKLGQAHKGVSVDYWSDPRTDNLHAPDEMEDRIINNKPTISNFSKFMTAIYVYIPIKYDSEFKTTDKNLTYYDKGYFFLQFRAIIRKVLLLAHKRGIPVYFFDDNNSFIMRKNPIKLDMNLLKITKDPGDMIHKRDWLHDDYLKLFSTLSKMVYVPSNKVHLLDKNDKYNMNRYRMSDKIIHDLRMISDIASHSFKVKLVDLMKKARVTSVENLGKFLFNKWKQVDLYENRF